LSTASNNALEEVEPMTSKVSTRGQAFNFWQYVQDVELDHVIVSVRIVLVIPEINRIALSRDEADSSWNPLCVRNRGIISSAKRRANSGAPPTL